MDRYPLPAPYEIYRPTQTTGRLEGTYHVDTKNWRPSLSYKYGLEDIKQQFTPAESFRHALATSGAHIRLIQRLEIRMNRHHARFTKAATKISSLHRGNVAREYFKQIKDQLMVERRRREAFATATKFFEEGNFSMAIKEVDDNVPTTPYIWVIKIKSQYRLRQYHECIDSCKRLNEMDELNEDGYYLQGCCWAALEEYDKSYMALKEAVIKVEAPARDTLRICAYIATKITPPRYMEAVDSLSTIIKENPQDFDARVERASCYFCLQIWTEAVQDLSFVIVFKPTDTKALLLRARAYACIRQWDMARADYNSILLHHPEHSEATQGLVDIKDTVIVLPMLDDNMIENDS